MSDTAVDTMQDLDESAVEKALLGTELEAGAEGSEADQTQIAGEENADEIDVSSLVDSQSEEERRRNKAFAKERIEKKKLKEELERLKNQEVQADTSDIKKPKRTDFVNENILYDKYSGDINIALAAFEDALDDYNDQINARKQKAVATTSKHRDELQLQYEAEEKFEEYSKAVSKRVPDFDSKISQAERILTPQGASAIKLLYGEDAPLMLAALGAHPQKAREIALMDNQIELIKELTKLQLNVQSVLSQRKTVSTAPTETSVTDTNLSSSDAIQKAMDKAAKSGNHKKFRELKDQLKRIKRENNR